MRKQYRTTNSSTLNKKQNNKFNYPVKSYRLNKGTVKEFEIIAKRLGTTYNLALFEMIKFYKKHNFKK